MNLTGLFNVRFSLNLLYSTCCYDCHVVCTHVLQFADFEDINRFLTLVGYLCILCEFLSLATSVVVTLKCSCAMLSSCYNI